MNAPRPLFCSALLWVLAIATSSAADFGQAASATNGLALDLYRKLAPGDANLCFSPYSIESALAMTFAGADGDTRTEMMRVLHFSPPSDDIHSSFGALQKSLQEIATTTPQNLDQSKKYSKPGEPITLSIANRLFAQRDYKFREAFLTLVKTNYDAPLEPLDFSHDPGGSTNYINNWVAKQTHDRIRDLIPQGSLDETTRMVLTNALYLKAPWAEPFEKEMTKPEPFHAHGGAPTNVPMMHKHYNHLGYAKHSGYSAVSIPYTGGELSFVILLPDDVKGLAGLESNLNPATLAECARLPAANVVLSIPKFRIEPPTIALKPELEALGMKTAFDEPQGSANFDRLAPRQPNEYLYLSKVFHKTFIAVDEQGTEAAAATAAVMALATSIMRPEQPIEVKVDRPFLYAIQHVPSGVCLFIGRVTDPR